MNNKALMGFAISVAGVVAGLYVYKMLTEDKANGNGNGTSGTGAGTTPPMFRGRRR
tara:strand:- start:790 stop:957 length:168 start_codon:yes stop_codon:yes gene_type:complete